MHCDGFRTAESMAARGWMDAEANGDVTLSTLHLEDNYGPSEHRATQEGAWLAAQALHANHLGGVSASMSGMDMADTGRDRRAPVAGTLQSWEKLLLDSPNDSMAFYWREMVQWCKQRGRGEKPVEPLEGDSARGKRSQECDESMDTLSHLVKRFRCSDDAGGGYSSPGPGDGWCRRADGREDQDGGEGMCED